jgi:hypothetical protein
MALSKLFCPYLSGAEHMEHCLAELCQMWDAGVLVGDLVVYRAGCGLVPRESRREGA